MSNVSSEEGEGRSGMLLTTLNKPDVKTFKEASMGGRFGKYGDGKPKALIRKNRLGPPDPHRRRKDNPLKGPRKSKVRHGVETGGS